MKKIKGMIVTRTINIAITCRGDGMWAMMGKGSLGASKALAMCYFPNSIAVPRIFFFIINFYTVCFFAYMYVYDKFINFKKNFVSCHFLKIFFI